MNHNEEFTQIVSLAGRMIDQELTDLALTLDAMAEARCTDAEMLAFMLHGGGEIN